MEPARYSTIFHSGQVDGTWFSYLPTSPITMLIIPRSNISEAKNMENINNPGIYYLISQAEDKKIEQVYVGMSRNGLSRLRGHGRTKFWDKAIMFLADEKYFTLDIITELKKYAIEKIKDFYNFEVINKNVPKSKIKKYDLPIIEQFYSEIEILMKSLGYFPENTNN